MDKETKCYFSSDISEKISCSKEPKFDSLGFPEVACPEFPCDKVKLLWESHKSLRYEKQIADLQVENDQLKKKLESVKEFVDAMLALHEWNNDKPVKPDHQCGSPNALCDCNCVNWARYCEDQERLRKAKEKLGGSF